MSSAALSLAPEPLIEIVVPVYNEETDLEATVRRLRIYLDNRFPFPARVTIVDNGSTDATPAIAARLATELPGVRLLSVDRKGRGGALAAGWMVSHADVVAYTDVDLSSDLDALLPLVAPLISGHSEIAIGSRLVPGARVRRGLKREIISRCYNLLLRLALGVRFRDAQCGFKAVRADVARSLIPETINRNWFFDTELLVLAQRAGYRIYEVPVDWTDDPDSRVDLVATALEDLRGVGRLLRTPARLRFLRFAAVGVASTAAYAGLYLLLRDHAPASLANVTALALTALANTAVNRRFTFGVQGRERLAGDYAVGLLAFALALLLTTGVAELLRVALPTASQLLEVAAMTTANAAATVCRYLLLSWWMHSTRPSIILWRTAH